jgi:hypothetical protein
MNDHGTMNENSIKGIRYKGKHKSVICNIGTIKGNGMWHHSNLQFSLLPICLYPFKLKGYTRLSKRSGIR